MQLDSSTLKDILLTQGYVDEASIADLDTSIPQQHFVKQLISNEVITKDLLGQAIAEYYNVQYINPVSAKIDDEVFFVIPELVAKHQLVVAISHEKGNIQIAMNDPKNQEIVHMLTKRYGASVQPFFAFAEDIHTVLERYGEDLKAQYDALLEEFHRSDITPEEQDQVIIKMVDTILATAAQNHTSDIHIEPYDEHVVIRFRVDGILHDMLEIEYQMYEPVLSRIKVLSNMRIDEHRAAQDGKFSFVKEDEEIDVRVSVVPTNNNENIVMRLLTPGDEQLDLTSLGLRNEDLENVQKAIKHPHGMLLVTGPTGSGKTTTLYSMLQILNKREVHIATIEDPVEYDIEGITQIQVNPKTNLTFASGLRAIVRQDPDIIMVGEIRDEETAGIAVNSALTGHLVLSTLHTNNAATTLPRLADMRIEPFLISSTVSVIIAQRLVRKICNSCRASLEVEQKELPAISQNKEVQAVLKKLGVDKKKSLRLYKGHGCKLCNNTGYAGRIGIFEVLTMSDEIRQLIMQQANADQITEKAKEQGMSTMMEDGLRKALQGETTFEEVLRVALE